MGFMPTRKAIQILTLTMRQSSCLLVVYLAALYSLVVISIGEMMTFVAPRDYSDTRNEAPRRKNATASLSTLTITRRSVDDPPTSLGNNTGVVAKTSPFSHLAVPAFGTAPISPSSTTSLKSGRLVQMDRFRKNRTAFKFKSEPQGNNTSFRHPSTAKIFGPGYTPTGGVLPQDDRNKKLNPDPRSWPSLDNSTCLGESGSGEPPFAWQKRAPHGILLGTMKGGTHALMDYLGQHPMVARNKYMDKPELHFYDSHVFQRNESGITQRQNQLAYAEKFANDYPALFTDPTTRIPNENMHAIDDSPRYLLWSDRTPAAILCVSPWAKLMAVLRNPVDRAISHYRFQDEARRRNKKPMVDWAVWIADDLRLLRKAGVVRDWNQVDFDTFAGSEEEAQSWKRYLRHPNSNMILGRGLYAIQIEQYFAALETAGKSRSELLVIQSEDMLSNTQAVYDNIIEFLELPPHQLTDTLPKHKTAKQNTTQLPEYLRRELVYLYEPYNRRLYKLLQWDNVWDEEAVVL